MSSEKKEKIKVTDKRKFDSEGNPLNKAEAEEAEEQAEEPTSTETSSGIGESGTASTGGGDGVGQEEGLPPVEFSTFILGMGTQTMMFLGLLPDPVTNEVKKNLPIARQMIDIISMLREKTKGNLDASEITTIDNLIFNLRMSFVELSKGDPQE